MALPHRNTSDPALIQRNVEELDARLAPVLRAPKYTLTSLPPAAKHEGGIIFVSDAIAGQKFKGSDGAAWVNLG